LWSKKKRPVGEPAARGIGVLEEQKLEVAIQQAGAHGGELSASRCTVPESVMIVRRGGIGVDRPSV
jgi:hypothetical protein